MGRLPDELLSSEIYATLAEARLLVDRWRLYCNHRRIWRALGKLTPATVETKCPALRQFWAWRGWLPCTD